MGRLSQILDYLNKEPEELTAEYKRSKYTHFTPGEKEKEIRKEYRKRLKKNNSD